MAMVPHRYTWIAAILWISLRFVVCLYPSCLRALETDMCILKVAIDWLERRLPVSALVPTRQRGLFVACQIPRLQKSVEFVTTTLLPWGKDRSKATVESRWICAMRHGWCTVPVLLQTACSCRREAAAWKAQAGFGRQGCLVHGEMTVGARPGRPACAGQRPPPIREAYLAPDGTKTTRQSCPVKSAGRPPSQRRRPRWCKAWLEPRSSKS